MKRKEEIVTFKVDHALSETLARMPNKSEFIRLAVLRALETCCPLCNGTGTLSVNQMRHWREFLGRHEIVRCEECRETYIACESMPEGDRHEI
jgi:uncharacterized protein YbaR (Trm112 family)